MEFKIEKGIKPPDAVKKDKYPFKRMDVGDSFFYEKQYHTNLRNYMWAYAHKTGTKYITADDTVRDGYRCWRIR